MNVVIYTVKLLCNTVDMIFNQTQASTKLYKTNVIGCSYEPHTTRVNNF